MATYYPDISHWKPVTNWSTVKSNCGFLISKATEGTSFVDSTLSTFISKCESNKIPYWLYVFLDKGNELTQTKFMVSTCKSKVGDYFCGYILDIESKNTATNVKSALDYLTGLGVKTMLYTMYAQYSTYKSVISARPDTCAWWEARYGTNNGSYNSSYPCHSGVELHQYTSKGTVPGIYNGKAAVDLNRVTGAGKTLEWFKTPLTSSSTSSSSSTTTTTSSASSTNLTVDGSWGTKTTKLAQKVFGTTQDSKIDGQNKNYKQYWPTITSDVCSWTGGSSQLVKAIQKKVGVTQDGILGQKTAIALQKFLIGKGYSCGSAGADGKFAAVSTKAFQKWLNAQ